MLCFFLVFFGFVLLFLFVCLFVCYCFFGVKYLFRANKLFGGIARLSWSRRKKSCARSGASALQITTEIS